MKPIPRVALTDGATVPALGLGTWRLGENPGSAAREIETLSVGIDLGMTLIDTAEMYGDGGSESLTGRAIARRRDEVFVVSKVYPHNAGAKSAIAACERSLARLGTDHLDLYLLHWPGAIPLPETVAAFERLRREGKIVRWGVSNFDVEAMRELWALPEGRNCATNQVQYQLAERGIEWDLLPWMRARKMPVMAYCPLGEGRLLRNPRLATIAGKLGVPAAHVALSWLLRQPDVIAIPASGNADHVRSNRLAIDLELDATALGALDVAFPPPNARHPLAII